MLFSKEKHAAIDCLVELTSAMGQVTALPGQKPMAPDLTMTSANARQAWLMSWSGCGLGWKKPHSTLGSLPNR